MDVDGTTQQFVREGFLGPVPLFTASECHRIAAYLRREDHPAPAEWQKGRAVSERFLYDLAVHPRLLPLVTALIGEDVLLWAASAVSRAPGEGQPFHTDIESSIVEGRFVSVWIGLENTSRESALQLIARSHLAGVTVQEARSRRGVPRDGGTAAVMLELARELQPDAMPVLPDMRDGEALLFDGKLWHGSYNQRRSGQRLALLLQYASADSAVRIPDPAQLDWPFRLKAAPLPPVILVSGSERKGVNRLVPAPAPAATGRAMVVTAIHRFDLPLATAERFQSFPAFRGPTRTFGDMACHASVLPPGQTPHLPHAHVEEEVLVPLHGQVDLVIADAPHDPAPRVHRVGPGSFVYYPAGQHHTITNSGDATVGYLMLKWHASRSSGLTPIGTTIGHFGECAAPAGSPAFWTQRVFDGPTAWLRKLHAHLTVLQPGGGYEAHVDAYDVAIVLLEGSVETLGQSVEPISVIYYAAGEPHGMCNPGELPARYLVFEFHAPGVDALPRDLPLGARTLRAVKRLARPIWRRVRPLVRRGHK